VLSSYEKIWKNIKCRLPSKKRQPGKAIYYMIPTICHCRKGKTVETVKRSGVDRVWEGREGMDRCSREDF
jgi:hypothetical protein